MPHSIWPMCALCGKLVPPNDQDECELKGLALTSAQELTLVVRVREQRAEGRPILLLDEPNVLPHVIERI